MMEDEDFHVRELQDITNSLTEEELNKPMEHAVSHKVSVEIKNFSEKFALEKIVTLDDALDLAYELEYSEVNTVFKTLIREFVSSEARAKFVLSLVREHVTRLEEFSRMIPSAEKRRNLLAVHIANAGA